MTRLVLSFAAITLALVFSVYWIVKNRYKKDGSELAIVREIPETLIFGVMLIAAGYALLIAKLLDPSVAGQDESSYNFVAVLAAVCGLSGVQTILTTFLKRAVAYPDKFVVTNPFGLKKEIPWNAVTEVKTVPLSLRVTFITRNDSVSVNGRGKEYGEFIRVAREKIPPIVGSDVLGRLYKRITKQEIIG